MGRFQRAIDQGARDAEELLPHLQRVWRSLVHDWSLHASRQLREGAIVAAGTPATWIAPTWSELAPVTSQALAAEGKTAKIRVAMVEAAMRPALVEFGLSFDVANPLVDGLLAQLGRKITRIAETQRAITMAHLEDARQKGLSIPHAAKLIAEHGSGSYSQNRAVVIARTELAGAQNGGSWAAARLVGVSTKAWLATGDSRTRKTHREADGQQVPINEPFVVGLDLLMYPGDPAGSAEEVIQCRCTVIYPDDGASPPDASATSEHAVEEAQTPDAWAGALPDGRVFWQHYEHREVTPGGPKGDFFDRGPLSDNAERLAADPELRASVRTYQSMMAEDINAALRSDTPLNQFAGEFADDGSTVADRMERVYAKQLAEVDAAQAEVDRVAGNVEEKRRYLAEALAAEARGETLSIPSSQYERDLHNTLGRLSHYEGMVAEAKSLLGSPDATTFLTDAYRAFREAAPLPEPVIVHRGVTLDRQLLAAWEPGSVITDKGFMSTGMDPASAFSGNVRLELTVPKGFHGISAYDVTGRYQNESELILPPGTRFYIDSAENVEIRGHTVRLLKARVLLPDA